MTEEDVLNAWRKTAIPKDDFEKEAYEIVEKALETMQELKNQNITMTHLLENYMKFEDECVEKGFTFNSMLEARKKQIPKKYIYEHGNYNCPTCNHPAMSVCARRKSYCDHCGQKLDWGEEE